jgi:UDP-glucose 4-epimerase
MAQAAVNCGVETFVLISSDKAVRPSNTMGVTKRFAELILQGMAASNQHKTRITMVRFGYAGVIRLRRAVVQGADPHRRAGDCDRSWRPVHQDLSFVEIPF